MPWKKPKTEGSRETVSQQSQMETLRQEPRVKRGSTSLNEVQTERPNWEEDKIRPSFKSRMCLTSILCWTDFLNYVPNQTWNTWSPYHVERGSKRKERSDETIERMFETENKGSETWTCVFYMVSRTAGTIENNQWSGEFNSNQYLQKSGILDISGMCTANTQRGNSGSRQMLGTFTHSHH